MEDIIQILVFAGIMIFTAIVKSLKADKKQETSSPKEVLKDLFPDVMENPEEVEAVPVIPTPHPEPVTQQTKVTKEVHPISSVSPIISVSTLKKEKDIEIDKDIRIRSKQDARRAFIYSEIFNRKY